MNRWQQRDLAVKNTIWIRTTLIIKEVERKVSKGICHYKFLGWPTTQIKSKSRKRDEPNLSQRNTPKRNSELLRTYHRRNSDRIRANPRWNRWIKTSPLPISIKWMRWIRTNRFKIKGRVLGRVFKSKTLSGGPSITFTWLRIRHKLGIWILRRSLPRIEGEERIKGSSKWSRISNSRFNKERK